MAAASGPIEGVGAMRNRLTLQRRGPGPRDAYGRAASGYSDVGTYWGSLRQVSAREAVNAERLKATASHLIRLRYAVEISPATDRFKWADPRSGKARYFNVEIANNVDHRNREWEIYATEVENPPQ